MKNTSAQKVVVGVDGSAAGLAALRFAMTEATTRAVDLEVVHCWYAGSVRDMAFGSPHELHNASLCMLDNEVAAARRDTGSTAVVTTESVHGQPSLILVDRSRSASLLVVGAHGGTGFRDVDFGTVATACRNSADCPVVVIAADGAPTWHHRSSVPAPAV